MATIQEQLNPATCRYSKEDLIYLLKINREIIKARTPIPEHDLIVLEKLYNKEYPDCGRKRGALLRYIKFFRENYETTDHIPNLLNHIKRIANETNA